MMYHKWGSGNRAHLLSKWHELHQTCFMLGLPINLVFLKMGMVLQEVIMHTSVSSMTVLACALSACHLPII